MGRRRQDRESYWRGVLQRQVESGLNVAHFCRQESLSAANLYAWKRKWKERDRGATRTSPPGCEQAEGGSQLLPVRIEARDRMAGVRILLPQGVAIDVPSGMDRQALVELLGALREAQRC